MDEIVYILMNESMQGYIKIGRTNDLEQRIRSLDTTSVPLPFECFYACTVKDAGFVEKQLHEAFEDSRVRNNREFFEISPGRATAALKLAELEDVTPGKDFVESENDQLALNKARARRSNFNFKTADIPVDSIITFIRDGNIKARVVDNNHIELDGKITTLSASARSLLGAKWSACGTSYWVYEGEILDDRRRRIESED